jgi:hypothetical protein
MPVPIPEGLNQFITEAQWHSLHVDRLPSDEQQMIASLLHSTFEGESPAEMEEGEAQEVIDHLRTLVDDLAHIAGEDDEIDEGELAAAGGAADDVAEEMGGRE